MIQELVHKRRYHLSWYEYVTIGIIVLLIMFWYQIPRLLTIIPKAQTYIDVVYPGKDFFIAGLISSPIFDNKEYQILIRSRNIKNPSFVLSFDRFNQIDIDFNLLPDRICATRSFLDEYMKVIELQTEDHPVNWRINIHSCCRINYETKIINQGDYYLPASYDNRTYTNEELMKLGKDYINLEVKVRVEKKMEISRESLYQTILQINEYLKEKGISFRSINVELYFESQVASNSFGKIRVYTEELLDNEMLRGKINQESYIVMR